MNIVPERIGKKKTYIWKNISIIEMVMIIVWSGLMISLSFIFPTTYPVRVTIALTLSIIIWPLMLEWKKDQKGWYILLIIIKYLFSPKKYLKNNKNDTKNLIPYLNSEDDYIIEQNNKSKSYIFAIKLHGFNIDLLSDCERKTKLEDFWDLIRLANCKLGIAKIEQKINLKTNNDFLKAKINKIHQLYDENKISMQAANARIYQLEGYIDDNQQIMTTATLTKPEFYLFIFANEISIGKKESKFLFDLASKANLQPYILLAKNIITVINKLINPFANQTNAKINWKNKLNEILAYDQLIINANHIKTKNGMMKFSNINQFPSKLPDLWLYNFSNLPKTNIFWTISNAKKDDLKANITKSINIIETNLSLAKKEHHKIELQYQITTLRNLLDDLIASNEIVKKSNLIFMTFANNKNELNENHRQLFNLARTMDIKLNNLEFQQFEGLSSFTPKKIDNLLESSGWDLPAKTIAAAFPFVDGGLKDEKGLFLGFSNAEVFFDQTIRDSDRTFSNQLTFGAKGKGKSHAAKKESIFQICNANKVIIFDPEREFKQLCHYFSGQWINAGGGSDSKINPLQIYNFLGNSEQQTDEINSVKFITTLNDCLPGQLQFLENWFKLLLNLNLFQWSWLQKIIILTYEKNLKNVNDISQLKNNQFPTLTDLFNQLILIKNQVTKAVNQNKDSTLKKYDRNDCDILKELQILLESFINNGQFSQLWDGHTTLDIANNLLIVFDLQTLYQRQNWRLLNAQMLLLLNYVDLELMRNRLIQEQENDKNNIRWIYLIFDEAHLLTNPNSPQVLDHIYQLTKRIRKYYGMTNFITQNIKDFLGDQRIEKQASGIVNNVQYLKVFNLAPHDLTTLQQLYQSYGGITVYEQDFIARASIGECLFALGGYNRKTVKINITDREEEAINGIKNYE